jgi:tetratricopeptide (TPR) repeat protein
MFNVARTYQLLDRLPESLPLLEEMGQAIETRKFQDFFAPVGISNLIGTYERLGQFSPAESWHRKWLAVIRDKQGPASKEYAGGLAALSLNLIRQKNWTDAEPLLREALKIRQETEPDAWSTFNTRSMLGGVLLQQKKFAEAEPHLIEGYEGLKARAASMPPGASDRRTEAIDRIIELYTALGQPDRLKRWQEERP